MVVSFFLSLTEYNIISPPKFIGLANYNEMLADPRLRLKVWGTRSFTLLLHVPLTIITALALAMMLNRVGKAAGFFRTVFYLPAITPAVAVGTLFLWLLNPRIGWSTEGWRCWALMDRAGRLILTGSNPVS